MRKAVAFLRSSAAAHLWGTKIIPLSAGKRDFRKAQKAARNLHRKTNPQHSTPQSCPSSSQPSSQRHRCTPSLAETHVHTASPIHHRFCRVTLVFISQPPFFSLLWCGRHSCGCSIKTSPEDVIQLPGTRMSAASDRWPGQGDRRQPAAGVCIF